MINYSATKIISGNQLAVLLKMVGRRPIQDNRRLQRMIANANLLYTAWDDDQLVGLVRGITDKAYCCYISDVVVRPDYQKQKIRQHLIERTHQYLGRGVSLVMAANGLTANDRQRLGFEKIDSGFELKRQF
ncbi:N-acetyltransferase [Lentilactobacillus fungorum]|uniref:N-acetyltransferase n=1 Tax=Lentilactobacillus fungorum TaxID=2201250 RepID=A0ABQ3VWN2_9LACO|nr:GNAT family N-acetyltransferase [Lentilactobacillus fungorum]GHP13308.1 N-acetyltransferase [Lentilactobacillus fungorum]